MEIKPTNTPPMSIEFNTHLYLNWKFICDLLNVYTGN